MVKDTDDLVKLHAFFAKYQRTFWNGCVAVVVICFVFFAHFQVGQRRHRTRSVFAGPFNFSLLRSPLKSNRSERKIVLLWTHFFSDSNWLPSTKELDCPVEECDVTSNRSLLAESSAVILHLRNVNAEELPPDCPTETQTEMCPRLVLFNKESPPHTSPETIRKLDHKIQLLATYRRDSDIYAPYGVVAKRRNKNNGYTKPDLSQRNTSVCWLVSNCHSASSREIYANDLKRHIDVEVYGKCGNKTCPHKKAFDCYKMLSKHCKFYLAFENSICRDYSTEKLYFALMTDMVPIVMGGDDYAMYLPPHSFINVEDFSSPKTLAEYLHELNNDDESYFRYFRWKREYEPVFEPYHWFCDLCHMLHSEKIDNVTSRGDLTRWWFEESHCGSLE